MESSLESAPLKWETLAGILRQVQLIQRDDDGDSNCPRTSPKFNSISDTKGLCVEPLL
jgi:hypothetical protein